MKIIAHFSGIVLRGHGYGQKTGAKTANLALNLAKKLPKGLYLCQAAVNGQCYDGLLYYGYNSLTKVDCLEVHLFNFSGDLYRRKIALTVQAYVRGEKKFSSLSELKKQIQMDLKRYRTLKTALKKAATKIPRRRQSDTSRIRPANA